MCSLFLIGNYWLYILSFLFLNMKNGMIVILMSLTVYCQINFIYMKVPNRL